MEKLITFICSGNICRSPMAEGILKQLFFINSIKTHQVKSAGTLGIINQPASQNSIIACNKENINIKNHLSQGISEDIIKQSCLILTMAKEHKTFILNNYQGCQKKVFLLTEFYKPGPDEFNQNIYLKNNHLKDIYDPIGEKVDLYINCYKILYNFIAYSYKNIIEFNNYEKN
jgi:protein-tyrosine-phosphatase